MKILHEETTGGKQGDAVVFVMSKKEASVVFAAVVAAAGQFKGRVKFKRLRNEMEEKLCVF